jgi:Carboxypeptidase regulatory-like domain
MTTPLTGNFDLCIEFTDAALSGFAAPLFNGQPKNFALPSGLPIGGTATLGIDTVTLAAAPSSSQPRGAEVTINFVDSSLSITTPKQAFAQPLQGAITVTGVPFTLQQSGVDTQTLTLDFTEASVNIDPMAGIQWGANSLDSIENALTPALGFKPDPSVFQPVLAQGLKTALQQNVGAVPIPGAVFHTVPAGQDGDLGQPAAGQQPAQPPHFAKVDDRTLAAAVPQPGVLCILGTIFQSDLVGDAILAKTELATDAAHTGSLTISPSGFQNIFSATAQKKAKGQLPPGTTITSITTTMVANEIGLHVGGSTTGPFYTATWTIDGFMLASISNGALALQLVEPVANASVSVDWWVWLATIGVFGAPTAVQMAIDELEAKLSDGALSAVKNMIPTLTSDIAQATTAISGIPLTFDKVDVFSTGMILQGMAQLPPTFGTIVQGIVTDPNEAPVPNATVTINPAGAPQGNSASALTDNSGLYKFDTLPLNVFASDPNATKPYPIYPIVAEANYFLPSDPSRTVTITWGQLTTADFVLQKVADITVQGHVLANGAPVADATVTLAYGEPPDQLTGLIPAQPDATGFYKITTNPNQYTGGYTVSVSAPSFDPQLRPIGQIANGATVQQDFALVAPHPFTVMGTVSIAVETPNDTNVGPAAGAKVSVFPTVQQSPPLASYTGQTDQNGNYSIGPVDPGVYTGDYSVMVEVTNLGSQKQQVMQPAGASVEADFELWRTLKGPPHPVKPGTGM